MQSHSDSDTVRIELTKAQKETVQRALGGRDVDSLELRVDELEDRVLPRLASNHNERCLLDA
jgi:hypothetical protein